MEEGAIGYKPSPTEAGYDEAHSSLASGADSALRQLLQPLQHLPTAEIFSPQGIGWKQD